MHRIVGGGFGLALAAAICSLAMAWPERGDTGGVPLAGRVAALEFSHADHVPRIWFNATKGFEVARDCRGCHAFSAAQRHSDPYATCTDCHAGLDGKEQAGTVGVITAKPADGFGPGLSGLVGPDGTDRVFWHDEHAAVACRECHLPAELTLEARKHLPIQQHRPFPIAEDVWLTRYAHNVCMTRDRIKRKMRTRFNSVHGRMLP